MRVQKGGSMKTKRGGKRMGEKGAVKLPPKLLALRIHTILEAYSVDETIAALEALSKIYRAKPRAAAKS